jgi:nitrate reductase delta subunit
MDGSQPATGGMMLGSFSKGPAHLAAVERLEAWTRERFGLAAEAVVIAAEIACQVPGCPPIETVIAFWGADGTRYRYKIFKPVEEVRQDDLPVAWLLPSLEDYGELGCDCC